MDLALALGRRGLGNAWPNPAVGAVVGYNSCSGVRSNQLFSFGCFSHDVDALAGGIAGGLIGLLAGTVIGAFVPHERWELMALPEQLGRALDIQQSRRAVQLTFSVSF